MVRLAAAVGAAWVALGAGEVRAQVVRLEVTSRESVEGGRSVGAAGPYELVRGRVHGEVDPAEPRNRIIQDLDLAPRNARGRVEYVATFSLMRPVDASKASGVLVYSVVNRGNGAPVPSAEGHVSLVSGWQGDVVPTPMNQTIVVPVAKPRDGGAVTGPAIARFWDLPSGTNTATIRLGSLGTAIYPSASLDTTTAVLTSHTSETPTGAKQNVVRVESADWAFADCRTVPFPGTPDPTRVCLKQGFEPTRLYELAYTAKDPLVLGLGLAATRDIVSFFRYASADTAGTANPVAGLVRHAIGIGTSQSGNLIKTFVRLGFNQDLAGRMVWDGIFPFIAARQTPLNFRFAAPGGAATLYEPGSEPVVWWGRHTDEVRGRKTASLLDRCSATKTCPKVVEAFGSTEFWGLRMSPGLVGMDARADLPLPENVRRYYMPGTNHGGGRGGFSLAPGPADRCVLPQNPNPMVDTQRALTVALIEWVVKGTPPPPSRYPTLAQATLVEPAVAGAVFQRLPGVAWPGVNPVLEYDFGEGLDYNDLTGRLSRQPPRIGRVFPTLVPSVDEDGNEVAGVASPLHQAPLGTYLGWNTFSAGFFKGQICGFVGGFVPFARTKAERTTSGDARRSLEERYGTQEGYVCSVRRAADALVRDRYLLRADADRMIAEAAAARLLPASAESTPELQHVAALACRERSH